MTINQLTDYISGFSRQGPLAAPSILPYSYTGLYEVLYNLYNNDVGLSDDDSTRRLRTVVNRSVEFYASKMLPGKEIGVVTDNEPVKAAIEQLIKDSNLGNQKLPMLRGFALYGDSFVRVKADEKKVYMSDISPFYVTDFADDEQGFLTYIRIDIPVLNDGTPALYTEYWDAELELYRSWMTVSSSTTPISELGQPSEEASFAEFGIDFIPIVHTKFKDIGDQRGISCVYQALDKILEANRLATRLHDMLFRFGKPLFVASANDKDAAGRPLPPPKVDATATGNATTAEAGKEQIFGDLVSLPGVATLNALVPNIDYADALMILNAHMEELEKDLPELRWYAIKPDSQGAMSGAALRTLLGAAIDRANEAKNNFLHSLSRMFEMGLTIGIFNGIFPAVTGSFDNGDFEHTLTVGDAWGESTDEKAATMKALTGAGVPAPSAMLLAGFTQDQVDEAFPNGNQPPQPAKNAPQVPVTRVLQGAAPKPGQPVIRVG